VIQALVAIRISGACGGSGACGVIQALVAVEIARTGGCGTSGMRLVLVTVR
jgi:hypothetical protein